MTTRPSLTRRTLIQAMFYGAGASVLIACGGGSRGGAVTPAPPVDPDVPEPPVVPATQLPLSAGPLAAIGPLVQSEVDGIFIPEGFSIRRVARHLQNPRTGLSDPLGLLGYHWHVFPDGGAVFPVEDDGGWVYVSNSETPLGGGVGALRFDAEGQIVDAYRILNNTRTNCAGGATPWGTWLSCEEVTDGRVYECHPLGTPSQAVAHPALGIFRHEAAAVDWHTRTVFMTEDRGDGRFYRFRSFGETTSMTGQPALDLANGVLEVLEVEGFENGGYQDDLAQARLLKKVRWVPVINPDQPQENVRATLEASTGSAPGTVFRGGEGLWLQYLPEDAQPVVAGSPNPLRAVAFFACKGDNRVYALDIDNDQIEVVFDNEQLIAPDAPFDDVDNVVVSPSGDVVVAEDGEQMRLMVMVPNQPAKVLVQVPGGGSELTGPAFTPDGSRLYFSSQRGPSGDLVATGVTYELTVPAAFRTPVDT
jgi:uncharacterized protein